jgi:hypothetical protein
MGRDRYGDEVAPAAGADVHGGSLKGTQETMALHYAITVKGTLDEDWSDWFDGLRITHTAVGDTLLTGAVRDQTALYGLIAKARDLGLALIAVEQRTTVTKSDPLAPPVTRVIPDTTGGLTKKPPR